MSEEARVTLRDQCLSMWPSENLFAIGIEAGTPESHTRHQLFGAFKLTVLAEHGIDELFAGLLAHGDAGRTLADGSCFTVLHRLGTSPHVFLAVLEETLHAVPETVARLEEVVDDDQLLPSFDAVALNDLPGALALAAQLNEKEPELASLLGDNGTCPVSEDGPVVDPLA